MVAEKTYQAAPNSARHFLDFIGTPISQTALSQLIARTKQQHKKDNMETDDSLLRFASLKPTAFHATMASYVKGVFRAARAHFRVVKHERARIAMRLLPSELPLHAARHQHSLCERHRIASCICHASLPDAVKACSCQS